MRELADIIESESNRHDEPADAANAVVRQLDDTYIQPVLFAWAVEKVKEYRRRARMTVLREAREAIADGSDFHADVMARRRAEQVVFSPLDGRSKKLGELTVRELRERAKWCRRRAQGFTDSADECDQMADDCVAAGVECWNEVRTLATDAQEAVA